MQSPNLNDKYQQRRFDIYGYEKIDTDVLEAIDYEYPEKIQLLSISQTNFHQFVRGQVFLIQPGLQ